VEVAPLGAGRYAYTGERLLGASAVSIEARGASFPGFTEALAPVAEMTGLEPDPRAPVAFRVAPLTLRWPAGDGDAVWIELTPVPAPGTPRRGGQVTCRVPDDGCHVVPEGAIAFLRSSAADRYVGQVRRERVRVAEVGAAEVLLEAASGWRFELAPEDAR
jgi:hypothetical protein